MSAPVLRGLVLSGGYSTRMKQDKGVLLWEGTPLIQRQVELLHQVVASVMISCRAEQADQYRPYGELLIDKWPPNGPMSGLLTAFHHSPDQAWFVLPVDMPNMDQHHVEQLLQCRDHKKIATVFQDHESFTLQPLAGIWEPRALDLLTQAWRKQQFSLRRILESHPIQTVFPTEKSVLHNVNRPEDLLNPS